MKEKQNDTQQDTGRAGIWFAGFATGFAFRGIVHSYLAERMRMRVLSFKNWQTSTEETTSENEGT